MPHSTQSLIDFEHDLRRLPAPPQLKKLLPNMASISMDDSVWDAAKELANHICFVRFRDRVERLLDNMTPERIHAERKDITMDGIGNLNDLVWRAVLEAALDKEVTETIDHQGVSLVDDGFDNFKFLLRRPDLQLLLKKD